MGVPEGYDNICQKRQSEIQLRTLKVLSKSNSSFVYYGNTHDNNNFGSQPF